MIMLIKRCFDTVKYFTDKDRTLEWRMQRTLLKVL